MFSLIGIFRESIYFAYGTLVSNILIGCFCIFLIFSIFAMKPSVIDSFHDAFLGEDVRIGINFGNLHGCSGWENISEPLTPTCQFQSSCKDALINIYNNCIPSYCLPGC